MHFLWVSKVDNELPDDVLYKPFELNESQRKFTENYTGSSPFEFTKGFL